MIVIRIIKMEIKPIETIYNFDLSDMEFAITNKILIPAFTKARQARFEHGECP